MAKQHGRAAYLGTMISLASAAFGVVAALAWNAAITALFKQVFPGEGNEEVIGLLVYAVAVTIIAVFVMVNLANAAERIGKE